MKTDLGNKRKSCKLIGAYTDYPKNVISLQKEKRIRKRGKGKGKRLKEKKRIR